MILMSKLWTERKYIFFFLEMSVGKSLAKKIGSSISIISTCSPGKSKLREITSGKMYVTVTVICSNCYM